jgi:hypothetical protein
VREVFVSRMIEGKALRCECHQDIFRGTSDSRRIGVGVRQDFINVVGDSVIVTARSLGPRHWPRRSLVLRAAVNPRWAHRSCEQVYSFRNRVARCPGAVGSSASLDRRSYRQQSPSVPGNVRFPGWRSQPSSTRKSDVPPGSGAPTLPAAGCVALSLRHSPPRRALMTVVSGSPQIAEFVAEPALNRV